MMGLKIIGAGFAAAPERIRLSWRLRELGFAPCYHMVEVFTHAGHSERWEAAARRQPTGALSLQTTRPASTGRSAISGANSNAFPTRKSSRLNATRKAGTRAFPRRSSISCAAIRRARPIRSASRRWRWQYPLSSATRRPGNRYDKQHDRCLSPPQRDRENAKRRKTGCLSMTPQGWKPLCDFLGVPVRAMPFPEVNTGEDFPQLQPQSRSRRSLSMALKVIGAGLGRNGDDVAQIRAPADRL